MDGSYDPERARKNMRLVMAREQPKLTINSWATKAGVAEGTLRHFLNPQKPEQATKSLNARTLEKLSQALSRPVPIAVLRGEQALDEDVHLVGYIGAGGEVFPIDDHEKGGGLDDVERPPEDDEDIMVAAQVRGDSMFPVYRDGDWLYYSRKWPPDRQSVLNRICAVYLTDGRFLVKIVKPGSKPRRFTLTSWNAPDIENVELEWASPIRWARYR